MRAGVPVWRSRKLIFLVALSVCADENAENRAFWMRVIAMTSLNTNSFVIAPCSRRGDLRRRQNWTTARRPITVEVDWNPVTETLGVFCSSGHTTPWIISKAMVVANLTGSNWKTRIQTIYTIEESEVAPHALGLQVSTYIEPFQTSKIMLLITFPSLALKILEEIQAWFLTGSNILNEEKKNWTECKTFIKLRDGLQKSSRIIEPAREEVKCGIYSSSENNANNSRRAR